MAFSIAHTEKLSEYSRELERLQRTLNVLQAMMILSGSYMCMCEVGMEVPL